MGDRLKDEKNVLISAFPPKKCNHLYKYLKSVSDVDIFYCEKCLEYKQINRNDLNK